MRPLLPTLLDHDLDLLAIIAHRWDVDLAGLDKRVAAETLAAVMLDEDRAAGEWARLSDRERGALQTLLTAPDHRMAETRFAQLFGEIRQMGPGRREREKPHLQPANVAEILFYRGLVALAVAEAKTGMQTFIYVPDDLVAVLPVHETGYDLDVDEATVEHSVVPPSLEPDAIRPATTAIVDDLTTLLAYLQIAQAPTDPDALHRQVSEDLAEFWLEAHHPSWLALMISLARGAGLVADEGGSVKPVPAQARRWLEHTRPRQVRALAETWRDSRLFNDLWHTPGLQPEDTGWRNDPLLPRQTVLTALGMVPPDDWWPLDELIATIKEEEPDFQRPAGDFDSWYIRDAQTGDYLRGFESWDRVDGAVLQFILTGPMHWLGLVDLDGSGKLCRLTVYGRALCGMTDWPDPPEDRPHVVLEPDGTVLAPRTLSRYERFQLARITDWVAAGDPYIYMLTAAGLQRAAEQGIQADAIRAFLRRASGDAVPDAIRQVLEQWGQMGSAEARLTRAVVLRTGDPATLQTILETPELRRYLGAPLGPAAVLVRAGQADDLATALQQHGILVEIDD